MTKELELATLDLDDEAVAKFVQAFVMRKIGEAIEEKFKDDPPYIHFPVEWGDSDGHNGPPVEDAGTIYICLPLGPGSTSWVYATSLREIIDELLDLFTNGLGEFVPDNDDIQTCKRIAVALREQADRLEQACKEKP